MLFLASLPNDAGIIVRQIREAGLSQPILAADWFDTPYIGAYAEDLADEVYFATQAVLQDPDQDMQAFIDCYQEEYGESPPNAFAVLGYDALRLIADAIERAGSASPEAIRDSLAQTSEFPALSGPITYPPGHNRPTKPVAVVRLHDGEISLAARISPEE